MKFKERRQRRILISISIILIIGLSILMKSNYSLAASFVNGLINQDTSSITEDAPTFANALQESCVNTLPAITMTPSPTVIRTIATRSVISTSAPAITASRSAVVKSKPKVKKPKAKTYKVNLRHPKHSWKSWMPHKRKCGRSVFGSSTNQYALQQKSKTGKHGIRTYDGRYMIALGSYYTSEIGQYVDIVLTNGTVLKCILGDQKSDHDTDKTNRYHKSDGSLIEFIVDRSEIPRRVKQSGDISSISKHFKGSISQIKVYNKKAKY